MSLWKYIKKEKLPLPDGHSCPTLTSKELRSANEQVKDRLAGDTNKARKQATRGKYNEYTSEERAQIGKYAAENGPTRAARHFSELMNRKVPETTARRLKAEYLHKVRELRSTTCDENTPLVVKSLAIKSQGRPLLLGPVLDKAVQNYISSMRIVGGVVNTSIVMAAAEGIIAAKDRGALVQHGGHIEITKSWAVSLLGRMGYVKRKCSNAGKVSLPQFEELQQVFLADIQAEVVINEIPEDLIFNWDQTALHLVATGQWTMHRSGEKVIPITNSDDKRQVTAVIAATLKGDFLSPQIVYKGKTDRFHPKASVPAGWDLWHSDNH